MASTSATVRKPILTFGIIADVQYANCDDGSDYTKTRIRYYRNSLNLLKNAVNGWKSCIDHVSFVLQLGDLIDGKCKAEGHAGSQKALLTALQPFTSLGVPIHHIFGNHEFYNFTRSFCLKSPLNTAVATDIQCEFDRLYYSFLPHPKLRIVMLDTYEVSALGYSDDLNNENYKIGKALLEEHNPNEEKNDTTGLQWVERRWALYNGGVGDKQLKWLSQILEKAESKKENVIIASHIGHHVTFPKDYTICLTWNFQEIMDVVHRYKCVICIVAGHEHAGSQYLDDYGIQHISFQGIIETPPGSDAYATARLSETSLSITGVGRVPSFNIGLKYPVITE